MYLREINNVFWNNVTKGVDTALAKCTAVEEVNVSKGFVPCCSMHPDKGKGHEMKGKSFGDNKVSTGNEKGAIAKNARSCKKGFVGEGKQQDMGFQQDVHAF
jgi:hypothetical protein